ncbi:MAG TPA: S-layer homology domain-containing protein [Candidatus Peribacteraceae bacterium]|nr:S-layer homology domain-containing protein [Candidatus Peribacteraceae bacterium]
MTVRPVFAFVGGFLLAVSAPVLAQTAGQLFPDVSSNAYFANAVNGLSQIGIVRGYDNGTFGPNDSVTRGQVAVMIQRYDQTVVAPLREQLQEIRQKLNLGQCGDGAVQTGEQCDDGNKNGTPGDKCTLDCLTVTQNACGNGHQIGDTYPSPDGCNTCSCTVNGSVCTLRACQMSSAGNPGSSSASAFDCSPYICADGAVIASCTSDGHPLEYFADPCLTHGGHLDAQSSSSLAAPSICGNGICEPGEANWCPACTSSNPPCMAACHVGTCSQDCGSSSSSSSAPYLNSCGDGICESNERAVGCDPAGPNDQSCQNTIFCPQDCARQ